MKQSAIIEASNLCKTYSTGKEQHHAIRNLNLDVYEGDFTVIMGNSGSGKSTLLYLLSGLDKATAGEVRYRGERLDLTDERKLARFRAHEIGYIYQSIHLVPDLTLLENVALPGYAAGAPKSAVRARAKELLAAVGLGELHRRLPSQVSGGQQQRAAIARALMNEPKLLFADEPTGSLNYEQGVAVMDLLTGLNAKGQSIVMVTHDMKAACRADRLVIIRDGKVGRILRFGKYDPSELQQREQTIFAAVTGE